MTLQINPVSFKSTLPQQQYMFVRQPQTNTQPAKSVSQNGTKILAGLSLAGAAVLSVVTISQKKNIQKLQKMLVQSVEKASNTKPQEPIIQPQNLAEETIFPYVVKKFEETALYEQFKTSKQNIMEFISGAHTPEKIKEFLFGITADETTGAEFIKEVTANPRESFKNTKLLTKAIGGEKNLLDWLHAPQGYNEAYEKYITKIFNTPETTVNDLINISPNWHLFRFMDKTGPVVNGQKQSSVENLHIGELPKEFTELGDFKNFVNWLYERQNDKMLEYSGKYMTVEPLKAGMSGKAPLKLQFCTKDGEPLNTPYIIKKEFTPQKQDDYINQLYRSDSVFLNAQIDYYLTRHGCENAPKFHYFDCPTGSAVYDFIDGEPYTATTNIIEINKAMKDLNLLGIFYNDCKSNGNILVKDGTMRIIDSGESYFHDVLRPPCENLHIELPNWCGNRIANLTLNKIYGE